MAKKRDIRQTVRRIEKIKTWQLVVLLVMIGFIAATFLRLNNIGMIERREAVILADQQGDKQEIERRLYDLQRYVSTHMNASPGRIALDHSYQRDNDKIKQEFSQQSDNNPHGNVYKLAADVCDPIGQAQGWRWPDPRYTACLDSELEKYPAASQLSNQFKPLPTEPYYHTFVSPLWSPDFAGWSVAAFGVVILVIVGRLAMLGVLRLLLARQYRRA